MIGAAVETAPVRSSGCGRVLGGRWETDDRWWCGKALRASPRPRVVGSRRTGSKRRRCGGEEKGRRRRKDKGGRRARGRRRAHDHHALGSKKNTNHQSHNQIVCNLKWHKNLRLLKAIGLLYNAPKLIWIVYLSWSNGSNLVMIVERFKYHHVSFWAIIKYHGYYGKKVVAQL
jgi:hypothetical protein